MFPLIESVFMFYNDYKKSFMVIEARGMCTKNIMKNISYSHWKGSGFYSWILLYGFDIF